MLDIYLNLSKIFHLILHIHVDKQSKLSLFISSEHTNTVSHSQPVDTFLSNKRISRFNQWWPSNPCKLLTQHCILDTFLCWNINGRVSWAVRVAGGHYGELDTAAFHPGRTLHSRHGGHGGPARPPPPTPSAAATAATTTTTRPHTGGESWAAECKWFFS